MKPLHRPYHIAPLCGASQSHVLWAWSITTTTKPAETAKQVIRLEGATVRLSGDSGDGMQLTNTSAVTGTDVAAFPDLPAKIRKSTPDRLIDNPLHLLSFAIGCEATSVARSIDVHIKHLGHVLRRATEHKGTAFVEVYQDSNVFNDGEFAYATDRQEEAESLIAQVELLSPKKRVGDLDMRSTQARRGLSPKAAMHGPHSNAV